MNWELVRVFAEVCKDLNISKAAERLGRSQSAVSQRLRSLEESMQTKLFDYSSNGLSLTDDGNSLYVLAREMSKQFEDWKDKSKFDKLSDYDSLEIELGQTLATMWLPHYLDKFARLDHHIAIRVHCISDESNFLKSYGDLCLSTYLENRDDIVQDYLMTFHIGLYASPDYLKTYGTPKTLSDLSGHRFLSYDSRRFHQYGEEINKMFRENNQFKPGCYIEINSGQSLVSLASKGHGIIALSREYPELEESGLVNILPDVVKTVDVDIYVSTPISKQNKKSVHLFREFLHNECHHQKNPEKAKK